MINKFWDLITGTNKQGPAAVPSVVPYDYTALYQALYDLYNNDDDIADNDTTRRLRTVVNRSVEFYAVKTLPGAITPIAPKDPALEKALARILAESHFGNNKPAMLRGFALYGDSFIRARGDPTTIYLEDISPFYATDFDEDSLGALTFMRIDIPTLDDNGSPALYTEYWDQAEALYRSWLTNLSSTTPVKDLGDPQEIATFAELGITRIPIVHTKFRDNGDLRGQGCTYHALDKIYEANRIATRLHDLFFRFDKPIWAASANDKDPAGRPLPAPRINTEASGNATASEAAKETVFGDVAYLPGMSKLEAMIPGINYADGLAILNANMAEIETDLPELRWYSIKDNSGMSGKAIRDLLGAAVDRATEAKSNFLASLSDLLAIAIGIGRHNGIFDQSIAVPAADAFTLKTDDPWGASVDDKAATMGALTGAGVPAPAAMKLAGFSDAEIAEAFPNGQNAPAPAPNPAPVAPGKTVTGTAPKTAVRVA